MWRTVHFQAQLENDLLAAAFEKYDKENAGGGIGSAIAAWTSDGMSRYEIKETGNETHCISER